jgi:hypothetical protein
MKVTQDERLLDYLKDNGNINPLKAWKELGIYRLSSCIHRLRKQGWNIITERINVMNQFDENCLVANYKLKN